MTSCAAGAAPSKKQAIIEELEGQGVFLEALAEEVGRIGKDFDPFDLICHVAFDQPPLTRRERAEQVKKRNYFAQYGEQARAVLEALLDKYADEGIGPIEETQDPHPRTLQPVRHPHRNRPQPLAGWTDTNAPCKNWNKSFTAHNSSRQYARN